MRPVVRHIMMTQQRPFSPLNISGLQVWFDASKITGLADGDKVAQWNDLSGYGRHATQGDAAKQMIYKTNILNGQPVVRSTGTNEFMTCGNLSCFNAIAGMTIISTCMFSDALAFRILCSKHASGTNGVFYMAINSALTYQFAVMNSSSVKVQTAAGPVNEAGQYIKLGLRYTGAVMQVFLNDVQIGTDISQTDVTKTTAQNFVIGSITDGTNYFWKGDIAELLIYNRSLSDAEMKAI